MGRYYATHHGESGCGGLCRSIISRGLPVTNCLRRKSGLIAAIADKLETWSVFGHRPATDR